MLFRGVQQGSTLSRLLFLVYIYELQRFFYNQLYIILQMTLISYFQLKDLEPLNL